MRDSTVQLSQMVRLQSCWACSCGTQSDLVERRLLGNGRHPSWHVPTDEQHGRATGMSVAMVHCLPRSCVLVLHCCLVVSTIASPVPLFWIHRSHLGYTVLISPPMSRHYISYILYTFPHKHGFIFNTSSWSCQTPVL